MALRPRFVYMHDMDLAKQKNCLTQGLVSAAKSVSRGLEQALKAHGLTAAQFFALSALKEGQGTTVQALADTLGSERTTMSRNADLMVRRGWILTRTDPATGQRLLSFTPDGAARVKAARRAWKAWQKQLVKTLGKGDARTLVRLLAKAGATTA